MIGGFFLVALFLGHPVAIGGPMSFADCQKAGGEAAQAVAASFADVAASARLPRFRGERLRSGDVVIGCAKTRPHLEGVGR